MHYGNPFDISMGRKECISCYKDWLLCMGKYEQLETERRDWILSNLVNLRGKRLGCFCKPKSCHGDVLVEFVESFIEGYNYSEELGITIGFSEEEKEKELALLDKDTDDGYMDPEIIPYIKRLNNIDWFLSKFCCWGHPYKKDKIVDGAYILFKINIDYNRFYEKIKNIIAESKLNISISKNYISQGSLSIHKHKGYFYPEIEEVVVALEELDKEIKKCQQEVG